MFRASRSSPVHASPRAVRTRSLRAAPMRVRRADTSGSWLRIAAEAARLSSGSSAIRSPISVNTAASRCVGVSPVTGRAHQVRIRRQYASATRCCFAEK
ncbi:hypothetical protein C5E51_03135 [Nocardia nova]|nr:hypothetical protein C5E51_03135 [Nocardia nova]